jgi:exosome complex component RRP41
MPVAIMPNLNQVTLLQVDGIYTPAHFKKAFELAIEGGKRVYQLQREALMQKYFGASPTESTTAEEE